MGTALGYRGYRCALGRRIVRIGWRVRGLWTVDCGL